MIATPAARVRALDTRTGVNLESFGTYAFSLNDPQSKIAIVNMKPNYANSVPGAQLSFHRYLTTNDDSFNSLEAY